jgi:hypothetical protein
MEASDSVVVILSEVFNKRLKLISYGSKNAEGKSIMDKVPRMRKTCFYLTDISQKG